jgi:hypothetical protein
VPGAKPATLVVSRVSHQWRPPPARHGERPPLCATASNDGFRDARSRRQRRGARLAAAARMRSDMASARTSFSSMVRSDELNVASGLARSPCSPRLAPRPAWSSLANAAGSWSTEPAQVVLASEVHGEASGGTIGWCKLPNVRACRGSGFRRRASPTAQPQPVTPVERREDTLPPATRADRSPRSGSALRAGRRLASVLPGALRVGVLVTWQVAGRRAARHGQCAGLRPAPSPRPSLGFAAVGEG